METDVRLHDFAQLNLQDPVEGKEVVSLSVALTDGEGISLLDEALDDNECKVRTEEQEKRPSQSSTDVHKRHDRSADDSSSTAESSEIWGWLCPCALDLPLFTCRKSQLVYLVGRSLSCDFIIRNPKVSAEHCTIAYLPEIDAVRIQDHSTNGTFVNGRLIGRGKFEVITSSPEISFGRPGDNHGDDIRFIFRHPSDPNDELLGGGLYQKYQQLEVLGKGAFGVVRKLHHRKTGQLAAVKIMAKTQFLDSRGSFGGGNAGKEIDIMMKLRHPNIVEFFNCYQDAGSFYIVMELVNGGDLLRRIHRQPRGHMEEAETKRVTRPVCQGLAYIHAQGITHRDLKPENILLTRDGIPKIADFGLAKMVDSQTFLKTACGTPAYLAPEVLDDLPAGYSPKVDSWSMAVIVYAMLTGHSNFHRRFQHRVYNSNSLIEFDVSEEVQNWLVAMLKSEARLRLSMEEALEHPWLINDNSNP